MRQGFDLRELEEIEEKNETELTLGGATLLMLLFGLLLICGACFCLGYAIGHRGNPEPIAAGLLPGGGDGSGSAGASKVKPSATPPAPAALPAAAGLPDSTAPDADSPAAAAPTTVSSANSAAVSSTQPAVRPALPAQATSLQPTPLANTGLAVMPATAPSMALMVQIAAVSHAEDADVLVGALRKRGYAVTVRRNLGDSLLHVQIGPFTNRGDANQMRQKLLNDGYNAIVQP
jgi:cell division septation protein DedD